MNKKLFEGTWFVIVTWNIVITGFHLPPFFREGKDFPAVGYKWMVTKKSIKWEGMSKRGGRGGGGSIKRGDCKLFEKKMLSKNLIYRKIYYFCSKWLYHLRAIFHIFMLIKELWITTAMLLVLQIMYIKNECLLICLLL